MDNNHGNNNGNGNGKDNYSQGVCNSDYTNKYNHNDSKHSDNYETLPSIFTKRIIVPTTT